jgi:hypothetical protein
MSAFQIVVVGNISTFVPNQTKNPPRSCCFGENTLEGE